MKDLRVSLIQSNLAWEDKPANLTHFESILQPLKGATDLIVLPEMFTTGFSMNAPDLAEEMEGETVQWLKRQTATLSAAIMGSCIIRQGNHFYNRLLFCYPDGSFLHYDKRHLFSLAGEGDHYEPGQNRLLVEYQGWKIMPLICYDLRFPVWSRNTEDYDLLVYVASWPDKRRQHWIKLLAARAIENQAYCLGVNRIGQDGNGFDYAGDSMLCDFSGHPLFEAGSEACINTTNLSMDAQQDFRARLSFLQDRDLFNFTV